MDQYSKFRIGQVVMNKNGRDQGKFQIIISRLDSSHVLVVDGKRRTIEKPKKKKDIHLQGTKTVFEVDETWTNKKIRTLLKEFTER